MIDLIPGYSISEIAAVCGMKPDVVSKWQQRGRAGVAWFLRDGYWRIDHDNWLLLRADLIAKGMDNPGAAPPLVRREPEYTTAEVAAELGLTVQTIRDNAERGNFLARTGLVGRGTSGYRRVEWRRFGRGGRWERAMKQVTLCFKGVHHLPNVFQKG